MYFILSIQQRKSTCNLSEFAEEFYQTVTWIEEEYYRVEKSEIPRVRSSALI